MQRQKACSAILTATSAGDVPNIKCGVDMKEAFEDAMKVIRSNNMVYAILEADKPSIVFHLDSIRDKLESCIQANTRTGLSQFLSLYLDCLLQITIVYKIVGSLLYLLKFFYHRHK